MCGSCVLGVCVHTLEVGRPVMQANQIIAIIQLSSQLGYHVLHEL